MTGNHLERYVLLKQLKIKGKRLSTDFSKPEELSGAGGKWKVIDETGDSTVIQQRDTISCGPAYAEMLLKYLGINDVDQEFIALVTGTPVRVYDLAQAINQLDYDKSRQWIGGGLDIPGANDAELLSVLMSTGIWIAELRELGVRLGHLVVVNGYDINGRLLILDPWQQTRYKMDEETFLQYWTLQGIYSKKL